MSSKKENIKNYYKRKTYEKYKEQRCKELANKNKKAREDSLYTNGIYVHDKYHKNCVKAFHNCHAREKNFVGYINEFELIIEKSFTEGMNWDNYGKWEVDHIIPLDKNGQHNVKNLQALWMPENRSKGNKIL